ncbi:MAG: nucleotidyltransferase domain-containing protein [Bacteroidota bacterium]
MNEPFGLKKSDIETIVAIMKENEMVEEVLIFGSRAKGTYKNGSDVDLALKGKLNFTITAHIGFLLNEETNMPYKFDVIDYLSIQNKELTEHIDRVGVVLYKRS